MAVDLKKFLVPQVFISFFSNDEISYIVKV